VKTGIFKFQIKPVNEDGTFEGVAPGLCTGG
jgi:hypothetical protein